ncbi:flagellar hook-length control protein FliK [Oscillibacter sp.]|uniref:flagellar hook-length control protein FliK n=1 Tax=Oscillibacter sp. TaxID=1945593 RepID=UPI002D7FF8BC|nr:flagellar hook-length control protein FliK [Oscillibacter sp.]
MEQLINTMLANTQMPQMPPAAKKGESSAQKDGFQKLLEQKQGSDAPQAAKPEKAETPQKPQEAQDADKVQETETPVQAGPKSEKELEDQMALAAMAMLQNPVVPVEQALTPEVQAEAAADVSAPLAAETLLAPEARGLVQEAERPVLETPVEKGEVLTADQKVLAEELPQTIEAPEASQKAEGRTVEIKVETGKAEGRETETSDAEESPELQGAETEAPVFEDVKAVPVKVGEAPRAAETQEPVEDQLAPKLTEALQNGETRVEIQLTPENLGKVTVEMTWSKDGGLVVQLHAENRETQNLLSKNTAGLEQLLGREVQQEVRVEVPRQEGSQRQDLYEQQQEQHRHRQQEQRRKQASGEDFLQQLRLGLIPLDGE